MSFHESAPAIDQGAAGIIRNNGMLEMAEAHGFYEVACFDASGNLKWTDVIDNVVCNEGKNSALDNFLKASAFTQTTYMGLITATGYTSAPAVGNTASSIATSASANGWNEAPAATCAARQTPSFGSASAGSLSLSTARTFSIVGTDTIKGVFLLVKNSAGTAPTATVANTSGAIYSAGLFTGGDKSVANGDTLSVSYTASL